MLNCWLPGCNTNVAVALDQTLDLRFARSVSAATFV